MWHSLAYSSNVAANQTASDLAFVQDNVFSKGPSGHPLPPMAMKLWTAALIGTLLKRARVVSPSTRQLQGVDVRPLVVNSAMPDNPAFDKDYVQPPPIYALEELAVEANTGAGNTAFQRAFLNVGQSIQPPPSGQLFRLHWTATTTLVAEAWTAVSYTLDNQLPAGNYTMLACETLSATGLWSRVTFFGQSFRPGMPCITGYGNRMPDWCYEYTLGAMGQFPQTNLPILEVYASAADTVEEGWFHVIKQ